MKFTATSVEGVWIIEPERRSDDRGYFARTYCSEEFAAHGLNPAVVQCNISFNVRRGTLRGLHSQLPPWEEAKLVRCSRGAVFDVALDLRPDSSTYLRHATATLTCDNGCMLYIPEGVYHGFLSLDDNSEVHYQMSQYYHPESGVGVRYNDPAFDIRWPEAVRVISERDRTFADYTPQPFRAKR
ncbi:dTDP-4-dehydrorhamnose 3,5-epimerase [candidate division GN15 bacterium]|uniref:dTDP-4-dehydrorhamnose 3,5-epimerase n=1 Tax=candidate division GN15 bacterium TaxID=2072418 RepID=A0A855X1P8_9BACT|nr:MAG: dTDP-4-dehydrorhamnose 3,5-epimerase [candidate division GN15 bacterium]